MPSFGFADRLANGVARALPRRTVELALDRPIVTFSFDDVPQSALTNGARLLDAHGVRGTFFVAGGLAGKVHDGQAMLKAPEYRELALRGHEIGHHTFSHRRPLALGLTYANDLDRNDAFLTEVMDDRPRNFAFPYGLSAPWAQRELGRRFRSGRSAQTGINRGRIDLDYLRAVDIGAGSDEAELLRRIDDIVATPGWLIFLTHDVQEEPSAFGCRPATLDRLIDHALATGCEVLTVDAALDRMGAPQ